MACSKQTKDVPFANQQEQFSLPSASPIPPLPSCDYEQEMIHGECVDTEETKNCKKVGQFVNTYDEEWLAKMQEHCQAVGKWYPDGG